MAKFRRFSALQVRSDKGETQIPTPVGRLRLAWRRGKLESLSLSLSPPRMKPGGCYLLTAGGWRRILGLERVRLEGGSQSAFQRSVWSAVKGIPWGKTRSYAWVAKRVGKPGASRAVGSALKANPWPLLIPCHRVVNSDGSLGGFSSGRSWKRFLLDLEKTAAEV